MCNICCRGGGIEGERGQILRAIVLIPGRRGPLSMASCRSAADIKTCFITRRHFAAGYSFQLRPDCTFQVRVNALRVCGEGRGARSVRYLNRNRAVVVGYGILGERNLKLTQPPQAMAIQIRGTSWQMSQRQSKQKTGRGSQAKGLMAERHKTSI